MGKMGKGRPTNLKTPRMHVMVPPDLKRRLALCAINDGVSYHVIIAQALNDYLTKRGVK